MKYITKLIIVCLAVALTIAFCGSKIVTDSPSIKDSTPPVIPATVSKKQVEYIDLGVPDVNISFKPYMDYRSITNKNSNQYKFIKRWAWSDYEGFMRCNGEKDLGIKDNYYLIALGSYYGTEIGTKYRITLDTGRVFYGVLADCKADKHTNLTNQYGKNKDVVEFLVDTNRLNKSVKYHGTANVYMPLNGSIAKIERIDFIIE